MKSFAKAVLAAAMFGAAQAADPEWVGIFKTASATHTWSMQKVGGKYADPEMKLVIIPVTTADKATMEATEAKGKTLIAGTCTDVADKGTMTPAAAGSCFNLKVGTGDDTTYTIATSGLAGVFFAAQHVPTEFERDRHYFYDAAGTDIEPVAQEGGGAGGHSHGHGAAAIKCECEARKNNWKIDCSNMKVVTDANDYLEKSCTTAELRKTEACHQAYLKFQAHHDYCPHDVLPTTLEGKLHVHEANYDDCTIHRQFNPKKSQCAKAPCSVKADLDAATKYLYANCNTCTSAACVTNFQMVLMAHDTCAESDLPTTLELGLHDYEEKCEAAICNTADKAVDLSSISCPAGTPAASGVADVKPFVAVFATMLLPFFF